MIIFGGDRTAPLKAKEHGFRSKQYVPWSVRTRGTSILGEVRNVEISGATQQLLCSKSHGFPAVFALARSKLNQIA